MVRLALCECLALEGSLPSPHLGVALPPEPHFPSLGGYSVQYSVFKSPIFGRPRLTRETVPDPEELLFTA